jgi:hypothetical protein
MSPTTHAAVVVVVDDGTSPVGTDEWNAAHVGNGLDWANVKDATYGALGNNSTEDTTAIMAAITAVAAAGGVVYFPPGTYITQTLTLPSNVQLLGAGHDFSKLKLKAGTNAAVIQSTGFAGLTGGGTSGGTHGFAVNHLDVDGNKANNPSGGFGVQLYGYGFELVGLRVHDCQYDGIYSEWGTAGGSIAPHDMMATVIDVQSHDNGRDGISWNGPHDAVFVGCLTYRNVGRGIAALGTNKGTGLVFLGCHSYGAGQLWAWWLETTGNILSGCEGEGAGSDATTGGQAFIGANDNSLNGGHFFSAGVHSNNVRGIVIGDGSHLNVAGTNIDTKITSCLGGAVVFGSDAGSRIAGRVYQASGNVYSGTLDASTEILLSIAGGATYAGNRTASLGLFSGSNAKMSTNGAATLTAGKCQVFTSAITANSVIFLTTVAPGGTTGVLVAKNIGGTDRSAGNWFFVSSMKTDGTLQNLDTSTFNWLLVEAS